MVKILVVDPDVLAVNVSMIDPIFVLKLRKINETIKIKFSIKRKTYKLIPFDRINHSILIQIVENFV